MRLQPVAALVAALAAALATAPGAHAGELVDQAAQAIRDDSVYVHPDAEPTLTDAEAEALRDRIREGGAAPTFIALLPESAAAQEGGEPEDVLSALARAVDRPGAYAVVVVGRFRAGSTDLPSGLAGRLATQAFEMRRDDGLAATLEEWVELVGQARTGALDEEADGDGGAPPAWLLGVGAAGLGGYALVRRRRRQHRLETLRGLVRDDLTALAEDVSSLELDVDMPGADPRAREAYADALRRYEEAGDALDRARRPEEIEPIAAEVAEGRHAMAVARARLAGQAPPERRPPCFFDPRHGPPSATSSGRRPAETSARFRPARPTPTGSRTGWSPRRGRSASSAARCRTGTRGRRLRRGPRGSSAALWPPFRCSSWARRSAPPSTATAVTSAAVARLWRG